MSSAKQQQKQQQKKQQNQKQQRQQQQLQKQQHADSNMEADEIPPYWSFSLKRWGAEEDEKEEKLQRWRRGLGKVGRGMAWRKPSPNSLRLRQQKLKMAPQNQRAFPLPFLGLRPNPHQPFPAQPKKKRKRDISPEVKRSVRRELEKDLSTQTKALLDSLFKVAAVD